MRTVKLTEEQLTKTSGRSSFPDVIYFEQETNLRNNTIEGRYNIPRGTIGESYHTFGIELGSNLENEFKSAINSTEREADMRAIRLSIILNSYVCFEVDDPGVQATSECFSDIFIQIYKPDGLKVSQNNIGFIRNFTTKRILIFFKNRTISSNVENEVPEYSIFITPLVRYKSGNELRDPSDYIIKDKDENDISENILYFGSFNNGNSTIANNTEVILSSRSTKYNPGASYITPYSYNTFSMKNIITKDLSNNEPFTNGSSFGDISYDSFLNNGTSSYKEKDTRSYNSNNKGFSISSNFKTNREKYEAEYYKDGKYVWKSSENFSDITDIEIDYNLSAGHRIEIDIKFGVNYNFTDENDKKFDDAIYRLIHSILYKAHIYRWNIDISKCIYKVFLNGLYKASSFSITANDILTLIIYDNGESIDSNVNKDDNFINNFTNNDNIIILPENSIFKKPLSDNLIKTNPYLNVFGDVSGYNSEYFVHDLDDSSYIPYDYEMVVSKNTDASSSNTIKDIIFPYNSISYTTTDADR